MGASEKGGPSGIMAGQAGEADLGGGTLYVAQRVSEREDSDAPGTVRRCARCEEPVWVVTDAVALADSCTAVVCSTCTGTPADILYIAPPGWG